MFETFRMGRFHSHALAGGLLIWLAIGAVALGVNSKIVRHNSSAALLKGETSDVIIGSRGTISLGRAADVLIEDFEDVWSINSVVVSGGAVYVGTSPNGGIYKYSLEKLTKMYPIEPSESPDEPADSNESGDAKEVSAEKPLSNEHIFAMTTDVAGRLLAGISGEKCMLCRFEGDDMEVVFEPDPNDAKYIFAIALDDGGNIFVGTGPEGKVYRCDPLGNNSKVIYDSLDKNILSLAVGKDGYVYAGSDDRGLVYKIDPAKRTATVLYDSPQPEISALLFAKDGSLCAAGTSAKVVQTQTQFASQMSSSGRPEAPDSNGKKPSGSENGKKLKIPNTEKPSPPKQQSRPVPVPKGTVPGKASVIHSITGEGFVTDLFAESVVFFSLARQGGDILLGTGNKAQLYTIDPVSEEQAVVYEDEQASQITSVVVDGEDVYLGMANPAKLVKLRRGFAGQGTYTSDLIDAGQPANWGKLQIEADVPNGCKVLVACRSGNVNDVNDPTFSEWTKPAEITKPVQLGCPLGRFCQYKLVLESRGGNGSPMIREIVIASAVPNLAPKVEAVEANRIAATGKDGFFKIDFKATDDNGDKLTYKIDFRKLGRTGWIELEDDLDKPTFEWDGKTVEDGRYEIRVTANDAKSNSSLTTMEGSRVSDPVVVDNTGPVVTNIKIKSVLDGHGPFKVLSFKVTDELSVVARLEYTVDSNSEWVGTIPDDLVYDTTDESFTVKIPAEEMPPGDHVITIMVRDIAGNKTYKSREVTVE